MNNLLINSLELEEILVKGIESLSALYACQKKMYSAVLERDWVKIQQETQYLEIYTASFRQSEAERELFIQKVNQDVFAAEKNPSFYEVTALFDFATKERVNALYRETKRLLVLSKTENDVLDAYITHAKMLVRGVLDAVIPSYKNKIYTRNGAISNTGGESLVLNRSM